MRPARSQNSCTAASSEASGDEPPDPLTPQAERFTARGHHLHAGTAAQELVDEPGDADGEVLAVVHDHQGAAIPEMLEHRRQCVPLGLLGAADRVGDGPGDERRVAERCEVDEPDAVIPLGGASDPVLGDQTGLAEAARSDDAHEPGCRDEIGQRVEIIVAPDDRGRRRDEVVSVGWEHPERRELGREVRRPVDLEQLDGVVEVTDPIATERREHLPARVARPARPSRRRPRSGHRARRPPLAPPGARRARCSRPRAARRGPCGRPIRTRITASAGHGSDVRSRCACAHASMAAIGSAERDEERVSVRLHLAPAPRRPRRPEDLLMTLAAAGDTGHRSAGTTASTPRCP